MARDPRQGLPDLAARDRAATDFGTNLVVLAGAGTGKTSLLVERALNAVGSGVASLGELVAITFTEKAAGELRERLAAGLERLRALARGEPASAEESEADRAWRHLAGHLAVPQDTVARRCLAAMEELDRGTVATIHSFCADLLRTHPVEAGVDPGFRVDSGEAATALVDAAWDAFVRRELGPAAERSALWRRLLSRVALEEVESVARGLASFRIRDELLEPPWSAVAAGDALEDETRSLAADVASLLARQFGMSDRTRGYFEGVRAALGAGTAGFRPFLDAHPSLADDVESSFKAVAGKRLGGVSPEELERLGGRARRLALALSHTDDELCRAIVEAAAPFARDCREALLRQGLVSFDGLLGLARGLLRDHPAVRRRLKRRHRLLFVDEFQDTDPVQYEVVLLLAEVEDGSAPDAWTARLEPGKLFVVGDAKQSIYRFRGADYAAYRCAVDRIVETGGARLDLAANFRSVPEILAPVNALFGGALGCWRESPCQPEYVRLEPVRETAGGPPRVELWTVKAPPDARGVEERREAEGRSIAEAIERWVGEERLYAHRQITVLLRAFGSIGLYLRPLRERGIPYVVDGGRDFLERPEVGQLMATLRALAQPADEPALLAYLRSPAGGVSDPELARYAVEGGRWRWQDGRADARRFPRIDRAFALLRELHDASQHLAADAVVRRVVARTRMLPLGAAAFEGAQRVANLQKLAAAAGELSRSGRLSLEEVVEALAQGRLEDLETDRPLVDDAAEAVRITSIHRMKGLENDVILLADLARRPGSGEPAPGGAQEIVLSGGRPGLAVRTVGAVSSCQVLQQLEDRRHEEAEEVRVLYVALTRARERLVLLLREGAEPVPWVAALGAWGYATEHPPADGDRLAGGAVLHRLREAPARPALPPPEASVEPTRAAEAYARARHALDLAVKAPFAWPSGARDELERAAPSGSGLSRDLAQATGIVIHRLLEAWDGGDPRSLVRGVDGECAAILDGFLRSDLARRFREVTHVGRELPLVLRDEDGSIYHGSIDLLYRDDDGQLVVADYKTDREADDAELARRYGGQLEIYARAVERALGLSVRPRTELWLLATGRRISGDRLINREKETG